VEQVSGGILKRLFKTTITKTYFMEDKLVTTGSADWRNIKIQVSIKVIHVQQEIWICLRV
jgi:hypothetical protein